jgi:16S rRNA C967 or C1407 C5-methylase (RsmB/RsmF family)
MQLPSDLLHALSGIPSFQRESMQEAHTRDAKVSVRFSAEGKVFSESFMGKPVPWCPSGITLLERPSFISDPLWHAGRYYVQEASSMFLDHVLSVLPMQKEAPHAWLDLCAAPGGKSLIMCDHLGDDDVLVSNEVIAARNAILRENMTRWGNCRTLVTRAEAETIASVGAVFDVVLADVPCSGSGLFRRDPRVANSWSESQVIFCAERQKKILSSILPAIRPGGFLIYSTCSFSKEENEDILDYLFAQKGLHGCRLELTPEWGIAESESSAHGIPGYRFWPYQLDGEGFFIAVLRMPDNENSGAQKKKVQLPKPYEQPLPAKALGNTFFYLQETEWVQATAATAAFYASFANTLGCRQWGLPVLNNEKGLLMPLQGMACSRELTHDFPALELSLQEAQKYLSRQALPRLEEHKGFVLCTYKGVPLGFGKSVGTRINNLYPSSWRIRKQVEME